MHIQLFLLENEIQQLSDLYKDVVPKYAAIWKDLGLELKIPQYYLDIIEIDNVHYPSHAQKCCKDMLSKWMQITPKPTWNILQKAINGLLLLSHNGNSKSKKTTCLLYLLHKLSNFTLILYKLN